MADIYADAKDIATLGQAFAQAKTDIDAAKAALDKVAVLPGTFTEADTLKQTVADRKTALVANLTGMSAAFNDISTALAAAAKKYTTTELQNQMTAADIADVVSKLKNDLPGFSSND